MILMMLSGEAGAAGVTISPPVSKVDGLAPNPNILDLTPLGLEEGDYVLVVGAGGGRGTVSDDEIDTLGYTYITQVEETASTSDSNLFVAYKQMGATPDTDVEVQFTKATSFGGVVFSAYKLTGVGSFGTSNTATTSSSGSVAPTSISTSSGNIVFYASGMACTGERTLVDPGDWTNSSALASSASATYDAAILIGYEESDGSAVSPSAPTVGGGDSTSFSGTSTSFTIVPS